MMRNIEETRGWWYADSAGGITHGAARAISKFNRVLERSEGDNRGGTAEREVGKEGKERWIERVASLSSAARRSEERVTGQVEWKGDKTRGEWGSCRERGVKQRGSARKREYDTFSVFPRTPTRGAQTLSRSLLTRPGHEWRQRAAAVTSARPRFQVWQAVAICRRRSPPVTPSPGPDVTEHPLPNPSFISSRSLDSTFFYYIFALCCFCLTRLKT